MLLWVKLKVIKLAAIVCLHFRLKCTSTVSKMETSEKWLLFKIDECMKRINYL